MTEAARSPLNVTLAVWRALFLHEALNRISRTRASWFWVLAEPLVHMAFLVTVFTVIRHRIVPGMDLYVWIVVGLLTFFVFRRAGMQGMNAVDANKTMFVFRQVKPADTVFVRAAVETFLMLLIGMLAFAVLGLLDRDIAPDDPLLVIASVFGIWLVALGWGLVFSVPIKLIQEASILLNFIFMPIYLISGVIFPISRIPYPYQEWLLYNPLVHALEGARLGFSSGYVAIAGLDLPYLYGCGVCLIFFGLALQLRFAERMVAE